MILHVDLDAFFASVEQLLDPSLRGKPVVVAGIGGRGVVAAASYEARRFGVHSALATSIARRRCPDAIFVSPRHDVYSDYSRRVMALLRDITPEVEQLSVDEAFLAVDGIRRLHGDAEAVARLVRQRVRDEIGLAISVGVASTKFLAKIASDMAKPDGLLVVEAGRELEFLHPLPVQRLWGVGPKTLEKLQRIGVETIGELATLPSVALEHAVGVAAGEHLYALAHNRDPRRVETHHAAKSIGNEETFGHDLDDTASIDRELVRLTDRVAMRAREAGVAGRVVTLKVRFADFRTITRSRTLDAPTASTAALLDAARTLMATIAVPPAVRLVGVHLSGLAEPQPERQGVLDLSFGDDGAPNPGDDRRLELERAVDEVRARFGMRAVTPATLAPSRSNEQRGA